MKVDALTSLDIYLDYPPETVIKTKRLTDVGLMYPVYCMSLNGSVLASTSVRSLISHTGEYVPNDHFRPEYKKQAFWPFPTTVDKRIKRLEAFECRTPNLSYNTFDPKRVRYCRKDFVEASIEYFAKWIRYFEHNFPKKQFVMFLGGLDSRVMALMPKEDPKRWHVFSSYPNAPYVVEWLKQSGVEYGEFFTHTNDNDDGEYLMKKVLCSEFMTNPEHLRWARRVDEIANHFKKECIFWLGNAGDTIYACRDASFKRNDYERYFIMQKHQTPCIQGLYHQMAFNMTGCPAISMYGSPAIWQDLYQDFEPAEFHGRDLRPCMGDIIAGKSLKWDFYNPVPPSWRLDPDVMNGLLLSYLKKVEECC